MEMMIVMAVIVVMTVTLGMGLRKARNTYLREATNELAATLKSAHSLAAVTGRHHRVMFDLEGQAYVIQACGERVMLHRERREFIEENPEQAKEVIERAQEKLSSDMVTGIQDAEDPHAAVAKAAALAGQRIDGAECGPVTGPDGGESRLAKLHKLETGRGLKIERIHVQHLEEPVEEGLVSINFFPLGSAEKAVVLVTNDDDDKYTLVLHGLTGRVEYRDGEWKDADEHINFDGVGKRVEERE